MVRFVLVLPAQRETSTVHSARKLYAAAGHLRDEFNRRVWRICCPNVCVCVCILELRTSALAVVVIAAEQLRSNHPKDSFSVRVVLARFRNVAIVVANTHIHKH